MYKNRQHPTEAECCLFCCPILLDRCRFCSFLKLLSYRHTTNLPLFFMRFCPNILFAIGPGRSICSVRQFCRSFGIVGVIAIVGICQVVPQQLGPTGFFCRQGVGTDGGVQRLGGGLFLLREQLPLKGGPCDSKASGFIVHHSGIGQHFCVSNWIIEKGVAENFIIAF